MKLQSLAKRVELSFVLDRLDFMAKSGRCSGVLASGPICWASNRHWK